MNKHISPAEDSPFIFDVLSVVLSFWWIFAHISVLLLCLLLPWEIALRYGDSNVAGWAISGAARGLEVGQHLPHPHSRLVLQAPSQQEVSSVSNLIEVYLQG